MMNSLVDDHEEFVKSPLLASEYQAGLEFLEELGEHHPELPSTPAGWLTKSGRPSKP
jgi:hypothetical protein